MQPTNPTNSRVNANSYTQASSSRARPPGRTGHARPPQQSQARCHPPNPAYLHVDPPPRSANDSPFYASPTRPIKAPVPTADDARREGRKQKLIHKGECAVHDAKKAQRELTSAVQDLPANTAKAAEWTAQAVEECVEAAAELGAEAWGSEVAMELRARAKAFAENLRVFRARVVVAGRGARDLVHDGVDGVRIGLEGFREVRRLRAQGSLAAVLLEARFEGGE